VSGSYTNLFHGSLKHIHNINDTLLAHGKMHCWSVCCWSH